MNKKLLVLTFLFFLCITAFLPLSTAQAKSIAPKTVRVYHPETIGSVAMSKETYKYQTLVTDDDKAVSIVEVF